MKHKNATKLLCLLLFATLIWFSTHGWPSIISEVKNNDDSAAAPVQSMSVEPKQLQSRMGPPSFIAAEEAMRKQAKQDAVAQYYSEDYTPLAEPVPYYVLWLGFTHVTYGELDFRMTDFDREYLQAVALNFEKSVESIANHNVDITVFLYFIDEPTPLSNWPGEDWLYLAQETVQSQIDRCTEGREIDSVLTTVQTSGRENVSRNRNKDGYGVHYVMLGLETANLTSPMGYSTFDLTEPRPGTWPLDDPEVPSLYATAVAVHEWLHQFDCMGTLLGIEYPQTHAYMGPPEFEGYQKIIADKNDYDFFEFYKQVLTGTVPYTKDDAVKYVGLYPKMWPLVKRSFYESKTFTFRAADGSGYLAGRPGDPALTISDEPCLWFVTYLSEGRCILSPKSITNMRIDLGNDWDSEGNEIGLCQDTGYIDAQSWYLDEYTDGSFVICTPHASGRLLTVAGPGQGATLCSAGADGEQFWIIEPSS